MADREQDQDRDVLERLLNAASTRQGKTILTVAIAAGVAWQCPRCREANPEGQSVCGGKNCPTRSSE